MPRRRAHALLAAAAVAATAAVAAAADVPRLTHVNQCMGGAGQAAIGPALSLVKSKLQSVGTSAQRVVSVLSFGDEPAGLYHWADLLGHAFGHRVDVDLTADVVNGALGPAASAALVAAVGDVRADGGHLVLNVRGLEALTPDNVGAAAVLMPLLDASQQYAPVASPKGGARPARLRLDGAGLVVVMLQFDYATAAAGGGDSEQQQQQLPDWASLGPTDARAFLRARLARLQQATAASPGGSAPHHHPLNVDALLGRVGAVAVLPPLPQEEVVEWRHRRAFNTRCATGTGGRLSRRGAGALESLVTALSAGLQAGVGAVRGGFRAARAAYDAFCVRLETALLPTVHAVQRRLADVLRVKPAEVPPAAVAFVMGVLASPALVALVLVALRLLAPRRRLPPAAQRPAPAKRAAQPNATERPAPPSQHKRGASRPPVPAPPAPEPASSSDDAGNDGPAAAAARGRASSPPERAPRRRHVHTSPGASQRSASKGAAARGGGGGGASSRGRKRAASGTRRRTGE
jgi:hypothetical protein